MGADTDIETLLRQRGVQGNRPSISSSPTGFTVVYSIRGPRRLSPVTHRVTHRILNLLSHTDRFGVVVPLVTGHLSVGRGVRLCAVCMCVGTDPRDDRCTNV